MHDGVVTGNGQGEGGCLLVFVGSPMVVRFGVACEREMWRPPTRRNVVSFDLPAYVLTPLLSV